MVVGRTAQRIIYSSEWRTFVNAYSYSFPALIVSIFPFCTPLLFESKASPPKMFVSYNSLRVILGSYRKYLPERQVSEFCPHLHFPFFPSSNFYQYLRTSKLPGSRMSLQCLQKFISRSYKSPKTRHNYPELLRGRIVSWLLRAVFWEPPSLSSSRRRAHLHEASLEGRNQCRHRPVQTLLLLGGGE